MSTRKDVGVNDVNPLFEERGGFAVTREELTVLAGAIPRMLRNIDRIRREPRFYWARVPSFLYGWVIGEHFGITVGQLLDQWEQGAFRDGEWFFFGGNCGFSGTFVHGVNVETGMKKELTTGMGMMETSEGRPWNYNYFVHANPVKRPRKPLTFRGFMEWFEKSYPADGDGTLPQVVPPFLTVMRENGIRPSMPEMEFLPIPAGVFPMGRFETAKNPFYHLPEENKAVRFPMGHNFSRTVHYGFPGVPTEVQPFQMMATPVTRGMWSSVTGQFPAGKKRPDAPVSGVNWHDCAAFAEILSSLDPDFEYSLPTETQWEYAARAGTHTDFIWGNDMFGGYGYSYHFEFTPRVRSAFKGKRNAWGLMGMWNSNPEWCLNRFDPIYPYPCRNLEFVTGGGLRAIRGGHHHGAFPVSFSSCKPPWFSTGCHDDYFNLGLSFRLVRTAKQKEGGAE